MAETLKKEEINTFVPANTKELKTKEFDIKSEAKDKKEEPKKKEASKPERRETISELELKNALDEEKQKILEMSEISLWLDTYDDIFSDFDPRSYAQRALSDDFLNEAKKASKEKSNGVVELKFLVPSNTRSLDKEIVIKKRLREHFKKHYNLLHKETIDLKKRGGLLVAAGLLITLTATTISTFGFIKYAFLSNFLVVALEPGGWFLMWTGLDLIFSTLKQKDQNIEFYDKMSKCRIVFLPY